MGVDRRKTPWGVFFLLLLGMGVIAYYLCGLFLIPDITFENFQEGLLYISTLSGNCGQKRLRLFFGVVHFAVDHVCCMVSELLSEYTVWRRTWLRTVGECKTVK